MSPAFRISIKCVVAAVVFMAGQAYPQGSPNNIGSLYESAKSDEQLGHLEAAVQAYQEILRLKPDYANALNNLGRLYYQQMRLDDAIKTLKRACVLDPLSPPPHALLGFSYYQRGYFDDARRELSRAAQLNPLDQNVKLFLARSLVQLGNLKGAADLLEKILQNNPHNAEALYTLGSVYSALAQSSFNQIQTNDPNSYLLELLLGRASEAKLVYADAAEHYRRAIVSAPANAELYYAYAHALWKAGDLANALISYRKALSINSYDAESAWEAAAILLMDSRPGEALEMVNRSLTIKPEQPEALVVRGQALMALGKPNDAAQDFQKAASMNPDDETVHFQLSRAYRKMGLNAEAEQEQLKFEQLQKLSADSTRPGSEKRLLSQQPQ